jgi:hypothetical protein
VDIYVGEGMGAGTSLGFNTLFGEEMANFLGGVVSDEMDFYSGRIVQGNYVGPSTPGRTDMDVNLEPALNNFTLKLYSAWLGFSNLPAGFDPSFIDRMAIYLEGEATHFEHDAIGVNKHSFTDPIGGKIYVAYSTNYGEYGKPKLDVGVTLINRAAQVASDWEESTGEERAQLESKLSEMREILDVLRSLNHIYGNSYLGF